MSGVSQARIDPTPEEIDDPPRTGDTLGDMFSFQEVFRRVLASAHEELARPSGLLFWSGVAAGLSLGLTFLARAAFTATAGSVDPGFTGNLAYPVGFVLIVLGRYQLFTENTLTPVALVLTRLAPLRELLRLWSVVLVGNLAGAAIVAALLAYSDVLDADTAAAARAIGTHALDARLVDALSRAVIAGWIVASMVWLVHAARDTVSRVLIVWGLMLIVGVADLFHVITASVEVFYASLDGTASGATSAGAFLVSVLVGNVIGGVVFVALLNTTQFGREEGGGLLARLRRSNADHR